MLLVQRNGEFSFMEDRINFDKNQIIKGLQNLGFTLNDSKVYFSLLTLGKSNPAKISEISGVDRPRVYDSLKRLTRKNFVEEEPTKRAPKYKAKPPKFVFNNLRGDYNQKISLTNLYKRKCFWITHRNLCRSIRPRQCRRLY